MNNTKASNRTPFRKIKFPISVSASVSSDIRSAKAGDRVATKASVLKPFIRFPARCVYCGAPSATTHDVAIRKGQTKKVGSQNRFVKVAVEFLDTYKVPFCREHFNIFRQTQTINIVGYIIGFILVAPVGYVLSPWKLPENLGGLVIAGILGAIGSLLAAWILRKILATVSERFTTLKHWPWFIIEVDNDMDNLFFYFHNKLYAEEFIGANQGAGPILE